MKKVGVASEADLRYKHFVDNGGKGLLYRYKGSPTLLLESLRLPSSGQNEPLREAPKSLKTTPRSYWVWNAVFSFLVIILC